MLQEWANLIDAWVEGRKLKPTLLSPAMEIGPLDPTV